MDRGGALLTRFVLDTSVSASWCLIDEGDPYAERVLESAKTATAVVPAIWRVEMANVLVQAVKDGRATDGQARSFISFLETMNIESFDDLDTGSLFEAARSYRLTSYDAAFVLVASRTGLPLATNDAPQRAAARRARVPLYTARRA